MRLLRYGVELSQLRHGSLSGRPVRRRPPERCLRRGCRYYRGPQPGTYDCRRCGFAFDHGRDLIDVLAEVGKGGDSGYQIRDEDKLRAVAAEYGIETDGRNARAIATDLADAMQEDFGTRKKCIHPSDVHPKRGAKSGKNSA